MASMTGAGTLVAIAMRRESAALSTLSDAMMISRENFRSSSRAAKRARSMKVRSVRPLFSWPCAMTSCSSVRERTTALTFMPSSRAARQAAMAECDLVALGAIGLWTNQNWDVLSVLTDELAEGGVLLLGSLHAVGHEGIVNQRGVEFDDHLAFDELLLDFFRALDLLGDTAKRLRYCTEGARLLDRAIKSEKRVASAVGRFVRFLIAALRRPPRVDRS